jgi:hypothetical protein
LGGNVTISGVVSTGQTADVALNCTRPEGLTFITTLKSQSDGAFAYTFRPDTPGMWKFTATWAGDESRFGNSSEPVTINVSEPSSTPVTEFFEQHATPLLVVLNAVAKVLVILFPLMTICALILTRRPIA